MKKRIISVLLCVFLLASLLPVSAFADTTASGKCGDNLTWTLEDGVLTISGTGEMYNYSATKKIYAPWDKPSIKNVIIEDGVTSIGNEAFRNCGSLTSVMIGNGVTSIGSSAFENCSSLTSVTIPNSVTSIESKAFIKCSSLRNVMMSNNVTSIGNDAFSGCSSLISVTIPDSVTSIEVGVFYGCSSLTSVTIGSGVTSIGGYAFWGCSSLMSVTIPDSVTSIAYDAFSYCSSLMSVTIPDSVTSIEYSAFRDCSSLTSVTIGSGVTSIGGFAFGNCSNVENVYYNGDMESWLRIEFVSHDSNPCHESNLYFNGELVTGVVMPDNATSIGYAFSGCKSLSSFTISDSVKGITENAFYGCTSLKSVMIPDSVLNIGSSAFENCSSLTSMTIPDSVTSIGERTCYNCDKLKDIAFSGTKDAWSSISKGTDAFSSSPRIHYNCTTLEGHNIPMEQKEASCTETGYIKYSCACGYEFTETLPIEHAYVLINSYAPTCIEHGYDLYKCSKCGVEKKEYHDDEFSAHDYVATVTEPTCLKGGYTTHTCSVCGDTYKDELTAFLGHSMVEVGEKAPTCTEAGRTAGVQCSRCGVVESGMVEIPALGHSYGEWTVTTAPTCTEKGEEVRNCSRCDASETRVVDALGHDVVHHDGKAATCTEKGWAEYDTCNRCDYTTYKEIPATGHNYIAKVFAPTCTVKGYTTYTCSDCGDSYIDDYVDSLGHDRIHHAAKAATCTEIGWEEYDTCSRCDYTTYKEIPATGHHHNAVVTEPTCTEKGYTIHTCVDCGDSYVDSYTDALGHDVVHHDGKVATCTEKGWAEYDTCNRCDYTTYKEIPATGHNYIVKVFAPTCTVKGYTTYTCSDCGDSYIDDYVDSLGHDRIHHEAKAETCTEIGWAAYDTCNRCDYMTYKEIPATGHHYDAVVTAPTCTEKGYTTHTCACGDSYVDSYTDALGHTLTHHDGKAATCTEKGWAEYDTCNRCDYTTYKEILPTGHNYIAKVFAPTCTVKGYTTYTCSDCGDSYIDDYVDSLGHDRIHHAAKAATCTEIGWAAYDTCSRCDYTTYKEIPATGHHHKAVVTAPTCTEKGYTTHTCACGDSYVDSYTDALGHNYGAWKQTKAPTCTAKGAESRSCTHCNATETRAVNALGHDIAHHAAKAATCTEIGWEAYDTCSRCDYTTYKEIPATGHHHNAFVTAPTCTEKGYTTHTCACGDSYVDSYTDALGHDYGAWKQTKAPTCTAKGAESRSCTRCNATETRAIDALGHDIVHHAARAATCTEKGWAAYDTCTRCDYSTYKEIPATGHHHNAVVTAPTCTGKGYTTHTCACGDRYVDNYTDALGHSYANGVCTRCGAVDANYIAAPVLNITTSAGKPKLTWTAVDGATKYWVYRSTDGKNYKVYDTVTGTSYTNTGAVIGTTYYYKVKAVKVVDGKNVSSADSAVKSVRCNPAAPTVSISRVNGKAKLSWKAVSGADKYWVYRSTDGKNFSVYTTVTGTSYTNSGAASGTKYYYKVKAVKVVNGVNVASAFSSTKNIITTLAKPTVKITTSNGKPKLTWNAVTGADKYYIYRSTDGKNFSYYDTTKSTSYTNTGAKKNTKYYYKVRAICASNSNANSAQSTAVSVKATK